MIKGRVVWETYNFPDGTNDDRWYHWCIENWGTKWDVQNSTLNMRMMNNWNLLSILRGVHPKELLKELREKYPDLHSLVSMMNQEWNCRILLGQFVKCPLGVALRNPNPL